MRLGSYLPRENVIGRRCIEAAAVEIRRRRVLLWPVHPCSWIPWFVKGRSGDCNSARLAAEVRQGKQRRHDDRNPRISVEVVVVVALRGLQNAVVLREPRHVGQPFHARPRKPSCRPRRLGPPAPPGHKTAGGKSRVLALAVLVLGRVWGRRRHWRRHGGVWGRREDCIGRRIAARTQYGPERERPRRCLAAVDGTRTGGVSRLFSVRCGRWRHRRRVVRVLFRNHHRGNDFRRGNMRLLVLGREGLRRCLCFLLLQIV
mmetsp:Transcript_5803/g.14472  ORF Transcript_5803/g.14472 Transcript_5803/m.14472 type:complete len:259 (-) Transcript_5803:114-890(-)